MHKTVGMNGRHFRYLPGHSAFGFRRSSYARGGRDQLVLEDAEGGRGRVSRIRVYGAGREVLNELRFLRQLKGFLTPPIDDNIEVRKCNEEAIKMPTNRFRGRCTRHVDVKHHIVRDVVENGVVRINYAKSGEQHADVLTKALGTNSFKMHAFFCLMRGQKEMRCVDTGKFH